MSGGTAGVLTWFFCYPMDTVKTTMQTYEGKDRLKFSSTILHLYRTQGIVRLYRGIHV